jgi:sec-independent protein translocase protein TatA
MGLDSPWHWIIVVIVLAALFGYKRLPDMSRSVARSLRIFKTEMKGMSEDDAARKAHDSTESPYGANPYAATPSPPAQPLSAAPPVTPVTQPVNEQPAAPVTPQSPPPVAD